MIRRALLAGAAVLAAAAPAAEARPSIVVQAAATGAVNMVEVMNVQFECVATNAGTATVRLRRCSFGPIYAATDCHQCVHPPVAATSASGNLAVGLPYDLCVEAVAGTQTVTKCAPYSYLTNTAVIAG